MTPAPLIMAAINGARLKKRDCPSVPVTIDEIAAESKACFDSGASAVHAHIRGKNEEHILDAGIYRELISEIKTRAPQLIVQITTESAGKYSPNEQRKLARDAGHNELSAALRELTGDGDISAARKFYHWAARAGVRVQHILYAAEEVAQLCEFVKGGVVPENDLSVLFVLGKYGTNEATPEDIAPFLSAVEKTKLAARIMFCAFGKRESECLLAAASQGADCRIGFENNTYNADGTQAKTNAERVAELRRLLQES